MSESFVAKNAGYARRVGLLTLLVAGLLLGPAIGCGGCSESKDSVPTSKAARVEQMTSRLPASTDMVVIAGDLVETRQTLNDLHSRVGQVLPVAQLIQQQIQSEIGVNILSAESWQQAGIAPNSGLVLGILNNRPILLTYVDDRQAFEATIVERTKKTLRIEAPIKSEEIAGQTIKSASQTAGRDMAWFYDGKLAIVALPAIETKDAMEGGSAIVVASQLASLKKADSLQPTAGFQKFYKALGADYPVSAYVNAERFLNSTSMADSQKDMRAGASAFVNWSKQNARGVGLGLKAETNQAKLRAFIDPSDEITKSALAARKAPSSINWESFATDKTLLGIRSSANFQQLWKGYLASLPDAQRRSLQRDLQHMGKDFGIDIESDVFSGLTGNAVFFFYGVDLGALMGGMQDDVFQAIRAFGAVASVQLNDQATLEALVQKLNTAGKGMLGLRYLADESGEPVESIQVLELKNMESTPGSFYAKDDRLTFATAAFSEWSVQQYLTDSRTDAKLSSAANLDLGKRFASHEGFHGIYINFVRAADHLGSAVPIPMVQQTLNQLEELLIEVEVENEGIFTTVTLDLMPAPAAAP
ncbi:MAG: DUF3352 domain-containing protein [Bradymonadaceae bacterium]|nr:DUF3352 domain-containing protein [Lujinxingiaceae bacterium]